MSERELDVVVYGATGFVGKLTAAYLAEHAPAGTRIGLGGRSQARLEEVRGSLGPPAAGWPLVVADSADPAALAALAGRTRAVATTVGPYRRHGLPLLQACAESGTHYADLAGEVLFLREAIDRFHAVAETTGARIVHSCGFDSIPSDLGVLLLHRAAAADGAGELEDTTFVLSAVRSGFSGGTLASIRGMLDEVRGDAAQRRLVMDPYGLSRTARPSPTSAPSATRWASSTTPSWAGSRRS